MGAILMHERSQLGTLEKKTVEIQQIQRDINAAIVGLPHLPHTESQSLHGLWMTTKSIGHTASVRIACFKN